MPTLATEAVTLSYDVYGTGVPVLFIPGTRTDRLAWELLAPSFPAYRNICYDPRDIGSSSLATVPYTARDMAADALALLEAVAKEPAHVIGHSLGGLVAQELALASPDAVRSLTLVASFAAFDTYLRSLFDMWEAANSAGDDMLRSVLCFCIYGPATLEQTEIGALTRLVPEQRPDAFRRNLDACRSAATQSRLPSIAAPALIVSGETDRVILPHHTRVLVDGIPGAREVRLPGGHLAFLENQNAFVEALKARSSSAARDGAAWVDRRLNQRTGGIGPRGDARGESNVRFARRLG